MKIKLTVLMIFFAAGLVNAQKSLDELLAKYNSSDVPYISVEALKMKQDETPLWILDTRELEEFEVSHIKNAQFVGYNNFSIKKVSELIPDKSTPIIVYCSLGIRSENIGKKLTKAGFTNVSNLYGGIFEWKNSGFKVYSLQNIETEKVHAYSKAWSKWLKKGEKIYPKKQNIEEK